MTDHDSPSYSSNRPHEATDKAPGVYVRRHAEEDSDLDVLYSVSRHNRDDKQNLVFLILGFLAGVVITSLVFILFLNKPNLPGVLEGPTPAEDTPAVEQPAQPASSTVNTPSDAKPTKNEPQQAFRAERVKPVEQSPVTAQGQQSYTVKSGDTLSTIAARYYNDSSPDMIKKLQRANNLSSPNSLSIGQTLVIPPKNY